MYKILLFILTLSLLGCATERTVTYKGLDYKVTADTKYKAERLAKEAYEKEVKNLTEQRIQQLEEFLPVGTKVYVMGGDMLHIYNGKNCERSYYEYFPKDNGGEIPYIVEAHLIEDYEFKNQDENPFTECIVISLSTDRTKKYTIAVNKDYNLDVTLTRENWVEKQRIAEQNQRKEDKQKCDNLIKETKCYEELWNAYSLANSIYQSANKHKLTPYKTVRGSTYEKRNINPFEQAGILIEYSEILNYIPEECSNAYTDNENLQEQYFNKFITKWNRCYNKLK